MSTEVKEKINTKPLMECLEALPSERLEMLYKGALEIIGEKKQKKLSQKEKIEYAYSNILANYMSLLILLNQDEVSKLEKRIYSSVTNKIEKDLIDNYYVFEIEGKYFIPEELKGVFTKFNSKETESGKKNLLMSYYILVNGLLKIETLISLMDKSSYNVTKKEIISLAKKEHYIIKDDIIYLNEIAESFNGNNELLNLKELSEYKVASTSDAILEMAMLEKLNPTKQISSFLKQKVKNKNEREEASEIIYNIITLTQDYEEILDDILDEFNINLNENELDEFYEILNSLCHVLPSWILNGYAPHELYCNEIEENNEDSFEDLPEDDKKEIYIVNYLTINGIIKIDKVVDLLTNNHNLKTNRKEVIKIVKENNFDDRICIINDYICTADFEKEDFEWLSSIKKSDNYKVINDMDKLMDDMEENDINFETICDNYNIDENIKNELGTVMTVGILNEDLLHMILEKNSSPILLKKQNNLYKELKSVIKNTRMWMLNGYKPIELNNIAKKEKIGRNEKCPCGSGKKYKQCCGK